ncbi:hypothetical protein P691DRAFT_808802 [Macrolepiota fuliginosa MF-IS2]|uniref:Uncharacterized protein n=1 Tax=Macrolepiota fuliginosa MF-IS2 TaxID=1400762 RepID=A0A9P5X556_9AGAR|nr:hypothetical protein P691DRAFT_808802 [Macrolepiota fuliginosa MF-IS2]
MSQQRTSSSTRRATSSLASASSSRPKATSSSSSAPTSSQDLPTPSNAQPKPGHAPSATPVIAGSLAGCIVLVVCVITFLLVCKRRQRLRAERERILRSSHYSDHPSAFPRDDPLDKGDALAGYGVPPLPRSQGSASSSGSSAVSPSTVKPHRYHYTQPRAHNHHSRPSTNTSSHYQHDQSDVVAVTPNPHNQQGSQSQPQPQLHRAGSQSKSQAPSSLPQQQTHTANTYTHGESSDSQSSAIFKSTRGPDGADVRGATVTSKGMRGSNAGVPAIIITHDVEDGRDHGRGAGTTRWDGRGAVTGEPPPVATSGANWAEWGIDGIPGRHDGDPPRHGHGQGPRLEGDERGHLDGDSGQRTSRSRVSASGSEYSYLASASGSGAGSGNIESGGGEGRMEDTDRTGLMPESAGYVSNSRQRTAAAGALTSVSLPSHATTLVGTSTPSGLVAPPPPTTSVASLTRNRTQQLDTAMIPDNTLPPSSASHPTRQGQIYIGNSPIPIAPSSVVEEDAPPAYENVWRSARLEEERLRVNRKQVSQEQR